MDSELHRLSREELEAEILRLRARQAEPSDHEPGTSGQRRRSTPADADVLFSAVDKTSMPMIVTDPNRADDPIVFANRAFLDLTGYDAHEVVGRNCRFLQGPDTEPERLAALRAALRDNRDFNIEITNHRRDGTAFVNALFVGPVFDADGRLRYRFGSQIDVTEAYRNRKGLAESKERHRAIFNSASEMAVIVTDTQGRVTDWNVGAERILGWSAEEMYGQTVERIFTPEDRAAGRAQEEMEGVLRDGHAEDVRWHLRKDGSRFYAVGDMTSLRGTDGSHSGFVKAMSDRTKEREAATRHQADAEFMRSVLASSTDCIKVLDLDGALTFMSEGGRQVMEVSDFNLIKGCPWPDFWVGQGHARAVSAIEGARAGRSSSFIGRASTMAGTPKWWHVAVSPIPGPGGQPDRILSVSRDITALRESEALVRLNIERVQLALAAGAIIGTWFWDLPSDRFTVDEGFARSFGLDPALGREGIPLAQIVATVHPDDQAGLAEAINEAIARGGPYAHQYRVRRADGRYYWIEANGRVDHAPDGTPLSFPGVLLDIEERRATKEALRASEERFKTILDTVEAAFAIVEVKFDADDRPVDYRFVEANPAFERQAGVNLRGKWITEFAPNLERFWFETYGHVAKTGEPANFENYAEAFKRWFDVRAVRVGRPEERRIAILFSDITERHAAQRALHDSETRFRALVTAGAQTIYRMSPDWQEMRALDGAGFLADTDAPGVRWLDAYIVPEDRPAVLAAAEDAIRRKGTFELEHRVRLADGGHGWTLSRAVPILDEREEIVEWFGAASDVTDRKLAEQERDLLQQELSHRMKNVFAMVLSIAGQTLRGITDRAPVQAFEQRIHALSTAHDVLLRQNWAAAPATAVVEAVLASAGHADRIEVSGPNLDLGPRATLSLSLLLHELTTNAAKYGALSVPEGQVFVNWHVDSDGEDRAVTFEWAERGGPPVTPPATSGRKGFGSRLISMGLVGTGGVDLRYPPSGLQATMRAPLVQLQRS